MATGTVKRFDLHKGYGFVKPDEPGKDVFVHVRDVLGGEPWRVVPGAAVEFSIAPGPRGLRAVGLRVMSAPPSKELQLLLDLARTSQHALRAAGVRPDSPAGDLSGWLVIERHDYTETIFAPRKGAKPSRETCVYNQIWLTTDGSLRKANRTHGEYCHWMGEWSQGPSIPDSDSVDPQEPITSLYDLSFRWDGYYGPVVQSRNRHNETIVYGKPSGAREHPAIRVAAALRSMTAKLTG